MVFYDQCACKGKNKDFFLYPKETLRNWTFFCFLPIHTSPNWPAPSLLTIFRVSLGISHSSWAQGLWGVVDLQGLPSLWHKPSAVPIDTIQKIGKRARMKSQKLRLASLTEMKPCLLVLSGEKHEMCPKQNVEKRLVTCKQFYKKTQQTKMGARVRNTNRDQSWPIYLVVEATVCLVFTATTTGRIQWKKQTGSVVQQQYLLE